jgi:hypothetical protein
MYRRLGLRSPALPTKDMDYGIPNPVAEGGARVTDALYNRAFGGSGQIRTYSGMTLKTLEDMVLKGDKKAIQSFTREYLAPNAPRGHQLGADWIEAHSGATLGRRGAASPYSSLQQIEMLELASAMRRVGLTTDLDKVQRGNAMKNLLRNHFIKRGKMSSNEDSFSELKSWDHIVTKELQKRKNKIGVRAARAPSTSFAPRQSNTFLDQASLREIDIPLDTDFHAGVHARQSNFVEDSSGNKYFLKGHLGTYLEDPGSVRSSFSYEFLAGRIGNMIGADTPQAYIIRRPNRVPYEVATSYVPSSAGLAPEKMQRLIQSSSDPIKTLEDILEAYAKYNETTPALNAVFHNTDLHRNNVMWDNLNKRLMQIDFGKSAPYNLRYSEGSPAAMSGFEHYKLPEAIQSSTQSMATVRAAINDAINEAIDLNFLNRPAQLELAQRARSLGFGVTPNTSELNPLRDAFLTASVSADLTDAYAKIANLDMKDLPSQVAKDFGVKDGRFLHDIHDFQIDQIKDRALVLLETSRAARVRIGKADTEGALFSRDLKLDSNESSFYRLGGIVKSVNSDNIPAMLTAGEYVVKRSAVENFGANNLEKINNGTYSDGSVYNYNLSLSVKSESNPDQSAKTVIDQIKRVDSQRIRGNRF